jgi:hypothetical protein
MGKGRTSAERRVRPGIEQLEERALMTWGGPYLANYIPDQSSYRGVDLDYPYLPEPYFGVGVYGNLNAGLLDRPLTPVDPVVEGGIYYTRNVLLPLNNDPEFQALAQRDCVRQLGPEFCGWGAASTDYSLPAVSQTPSFDMPSNTGGTDLTNLLAGLALLVALSDTDGADEPAGSTPTSSRTDTPSPSQSQPANSSASTIPTSVAVEMTDTEQFITSLYMDTLGRLPDAAGVVTYTAVLDAGSAAVLNSVATDFVTSREYRSNLIADDFRDILDRAGSASDINYWVGELERGATHEQVLAAFASTPEYFQMAGGTNEAWLRDVFEDALDRELDEGGRTFFLNALNRGTSRDQVAAQIWSSDEYKSQFVATQYDRFLYRNPDAGETAYWRGVLSNTAAAPGRATPTETLIAGLLQSKEYFQSYASSPSLYVTSLYANVLGRTPDAAGFQINRDRVVNGMTELREEVVRQLVNSDDYHAAVVRDYFDEHLGRSATDGDVAYWVGRMRQGAKAEDVLAGIMGSGEYARLVGGGDAGWLDAVYNDLLGRAVDAGGRAYFLGELAAQRLSREQVAESILDSDEHRGRLADDLFFEYLGRSATDGDRQFCLNSFRNGARGEDLVALLASSTEYFKNAG